MSREISIGYRTSDGYTDIPIDAPYFLFGCQRPSVEFWAIPRIRELGIERLADLGQFDPIYFTGWEDMDRLGWEIALLHLHLPSIDFHAESKARWAAHLAYCYQLLIQTAPRDSSPEFTIG